MHSGQIDKEYAILENIYHQPEKVRQRDLAHIAGISLGMTNTILKRLINKGLLVSRKINHRNIHYAVTPTGLNEIMQRSYRYFKRTIKNIVDYKEKIRQMVQEIATRGFTKILFVGDSDLNFIIEHCARQAGLALETTSEKNIPPAGAGDCVVLSEKITRQIPDGPPGQVSLFEYLHGIVEDGTPGGAR